MKAFTLDFGFTESKHSLAMKSWAEFAVWQLALLLWEHVKEAYFRLASHVSWKFISVWHLDFKNQ